MLKNNYEQIDKQEIQKSELIDREATVKQICKMGEMLGNCHDKDVTIAIALFVQDDRSAFPAVFTCNACKNMGNERECVDCHDYSNYVHYEQRPHSEWLPMMTKDDYGEQVLGYKCKTCGWLKSHDKMPFCENCGADMREGDAK